MSKYTNGEVQQIIDDLDYATVFFRIEGEAFKCHPEYAQVRRSLLNASDILTQLSIETIEAIDKTREVFEPVTQEAV